MNRLRIARLADLGRTLGVLVAVCAPALLLLLPQALRAQERVSAAECCQTLLLPRGARALSLGNALTARGGGDGLFVNPASIAALDLAEIRVHTERSDFTKATAISGLFGIGPVGVAGLTFSMIDYGESQNTDDFGNVLGSSQSLDQVLGLSFGTTAVRGVDAGITYKIFQWRHLCVAFCGAEAFTATAQLIDAGIRIAPAWPRSLQLGVAALNLGPRLQVNNADQADPTPARLRVGGAYEVLQHFRVDSTSLLVLSLDMSAGLRENIERQFGGGAELILDQSLFVRAGYSSGTGLGTGASIGVGLLYDRFDIGVAKSFGSNDLSTAPFQITFAVRF